MGRTVSAVLMLMREREGPGRKEVFKGKHKLSERKQMWEELVSWVQRRIWLGWKAMLRDRRGGEGAV